jgi:cell division protein FtsZ
MMQFEIPKNNPSIIKVIGVGGGGSNAVNHMYRQGIKGVDFIVCNTDHQALDISPVPNRIQLGYSLTEGRGAGSIAEVGKNAAIENMDEIRNLLSDGTKMVFITAGMGGGTGTGAAPIIAAVAREMGILTVGIITIPFSFEGKKRRIQAEDGLEELKNNVDTLLIICNDKLREMYGNLTLANAFAKADNILTTAAKGIAEIITITGYINVDFEDVKTVMTDSGVAIMGSALAEGENRAVRAVEEALASPLLNDNNIEGARYILLNIASGTKEVTMDEISEITDYIQDSAGLSADIIWGNCIDETLDEKISVTIIATGFKTKQEIGYNISGGKINSNNNRVVHELKNEETSSVNNQEASKKEEEITDPMEPVLIHKSPVEEQSITFEYEFAIPQEADPAPVQSLFPTENDNTPLPPNPAKTETKPYSESESMDEQLRRSREKILRLRELSIKPKSYASISDLEKEPAYKRKNIRLENVTPSSESEISRYTLGEDENKTPGIKPNNSFLHDNVD